jgi:hypothetical protein
MTASAAALICCVGVAAGIGLAICAGAELLVLFDDVATATTPRMTTVITLLVMIVMIVVASFFIGLVDC